MKTPGLKLLKYSVDSARSAVQVFCLAFEKEDLRIRTPVDSVTGHLNRRVHRVSQRPLHVDDRLSEAPEGLSVDSARSAVQVCCNPF
jgi:hypothetical protein